MPIALIVVIILVALAAIVIFATLQGRDKASATGRLSRETLSRDRSSVTVNETRVDISQSGSDELPKSGKDFEREVALERSRASQPVPAEVSAAAEWQKPDEEQIGVARRQFLNRSILGAFGLGLSGFGGGVLVYLWPPFISGFGAPIEVGKISDIIQTIRDNGGFYYRPDGRMWLTEYPAGAIERAKAVYSGPELAGMEAGVVALYQKCPHLGCRVPECLTSQWFECPCHGSKYNRVGEKRGGPAPRGMDRFAMSVSSDGVLTVNTGRVIQGPAIGVNTTGQEAEGPNCIGAASH